MMLRDPKLGGSVWMFCCCCVACRWGSSFSFSKSKDQFPSIEFSTPLSSDRSVTVCPGKIKPSLFRSSSSLSRSVFPSVSLVLLSLPFFSFSCFFDTYYYTDLSLYLYMLFLLCLSLDFLCHVLYRSFPLFTL